MAHRSGRLKKELAQFQSEPVPGISVSVEDSNMTSFKCQIIGEHDPVFINTTLYIRILLKIDITEVHVLKW